MEHQKYKTCSIFTARFSFMQADIQEAVASLISGKIILYPTDTIWGIGCDATNESAVEKIFDIKNRPREKSLIVLVDSVKMLKEFVTITPEMESLLASFQEPVTVIYPHPKGFAANVVNADDTIAIRIANHDFCRQLIRQFGKPVVSTSANISGEKSPLSFEDISVCVKDKVDYMVDKQYDTSKYKNPSKLMKLHPDNSMEYLR